MSAPALPEVLAALALMYLGDERKALFCWHDEDAYFSIEFATGGKFRVEFAAFDECISRGWICADGEDVTVTEQGRYWARKWLKRNRLEMAK
jgi:hypothetical protein